MRTFIRLTVILLILLSASNVFYEYRVDRPEMSMTETYTEKEKTIISYEYNASSMVICIFYLIALATIIRKHITNISSCELIFYITTAIPAVLNVIYIDTHKETCLESLTYITSG